MNLDTDTSPCSRLWVRFWMRHAAPQPAGRVACRLASWAVPPHRGLVDLARRYPRGYFAWSARIRHPGFRWGRYDYVGERAVVYRNPEGGPVTIGDRVDIHDDVILETGLGGSIEVGPGSRLQHRCFLSAFKSSIIIGADVGVAVNSSFFPHNHGVAAGTPVSRQPLRSRGDIVVGDHSWIGAGVTVLSGVRIGEGAVIGAGAVVTQDIPDNAIAAGNPARVVRMRSGDA